MVSRSLVLAVVASVVLGAVVVRPQPNRIDRVSPMAPELAEFGDHPVGVRTLQVVDRDRPNVGEAREGRATPRYDRALTTEIWYPASRQPGEDAGGTYRTVSRDPSIAVTLHGRAVRDAVARIDVTSPLLVVSHGHPGNRYLMSHLGENLASKGYVVVAIDHADSTYDDERPIASALYNRPFDVLFVIDEIARLARPGSSSFLAGIVDADRVGVVGYSLGAYGVINVVGAGFTEVSALLPGAPPNGLLAERSSGSATLRRGADPRIKAALAVAPWGMRGGFWDEQGLLGIRTPVFFVAGSLDGVAGYETGTREMFRQARRADRYLLTYVNAGHSAGAPIPVPREMVEQGASFETYSHYADPVWDSVRMNNILNHFATAWFGLHLKDDLALGEFLDLPSDPRTASGGWMGFKPRTAAGLRLEHADAEP